MPPLDLKRQKEKTALSLWELKELELLHWELRRDTPTLQKYKVKEEQEPQQKCRKCTGFCFSSLSSRLLVVPLIVQIHPEAESKELEITLVVFSLLGDRAGQGNLENGWEKSNGE